MKRNWVIRIRGWVKKIVDIPFRDRVVKRAALLVLLLALILLCAAHPAGAANGAVDIRDDKLRQALLDSGADTDGNGELTADEMAALTGVLDLSGRSIKDIAGLELAANITELNLAGNAIDDIGVIAALDQLTALNLSDNRILDISPLSDLNGAAEERALQSVDISGNYLSTADGSEARVIIDALRAAGVQVTFDPQKPIPAMGVVLNATEFDMCPGDRATLAAMVVPEGAVNQTVTWQTSDPAVASVENGVVTAAAPGQAVIMVTTDEGGWTDTCEVRIKEGALSSDVYTLSGSLIYAAPLTTTARLIENMNNDTGDVAIRDADGNKADGNVVTGMTVNLTVGGIERDARTVVIKGDLNGDGVVSIRDYTLLNLHIQGLKTLDTIFAIAADYDGDLRLSEADAAGMRRAFSGVDASGEGLSALPDVANPQLRTFLETAMAQLGKPYVWGAEGPNSFDCSGFVYYCLQQAGYDVERLTADMYSRNKKWKRIEKEDLQPGDLMFYYSDDPADKGRRMGHTGIYLGNGYHIHASSDYGCVIICGVQGWYNNALAYGRRVFE